MRPIDDPERRKFITERIVNTPLTAEEYDYFLDMYLRWDEQLDAGEIADQGDARWIDRTRKDLWSGQITREQVAGMVRSKYLTDLWDKEHREPVPFEAINWRTGEIKPPPYFRE